MTDNSEKTGIRPASRRTDKQEERRARQAQALRRNLARRKAQSRGRTGDDGGLDGRYTENRQES